MPTAERVTDWLRDAVRLQCGGVIMGTVLDARRHPIRSAEVRLGSFLAHTDSRGRFRLTRLPQLAAATFEVSARGHVPAAVAVAHPDPYETTRVLVIPLHKARRGSARRARTHARSELAGDHIAPSGWRESATRTVAVSRVPSGEWVTLLSVNQGERKARLLSRLQRVEGGKRTVLVYRVPLSQLPDGAVPGANFLATAAGLAATTYAPRKLAAYRHFLAGKNEVERPRLPPTTHGRRQAIRSYVRALVRSGALGAPAHR